jgi:hypothetical protein
MSGSLSTAREAMADAINTINGLKAHPRVPGQVHTPCAIVEPGEVDWRTAQQRGHDKWDILIRVLLGTVSNEAAQLARDEFFDRGGPKDIKDAIEAHVPLRDGTAAQDVFVAQARKFDAWTYAGVTYLGVEFLTEVYL